MQAMSSNLQYRPNAVLFLRPHKARSGGFTMVQMVHLYRAYLSKLEKGPTFRLYQIVI